MHTGHGSTRTYYNPDAFTAILMANRAVGETNRLLANGRGNLVNDIIESRGASTTQLDVGRNAPRFSPPNMGIWIFQKAIAAMRAKAGNCGECAALAFSLLHCWRVGPISFCRSSNADHAFVLIKVVGDYIICDPWAFRIENNQVVNNGLGRYNTLSLLKPIYRSPSVLYSVDTPGFCPLDTFGGSVENFEAMEYGFTDNDEGVNQILNSGHVWRGI